MHSSLSCFSTASHHYLRVSIFQLQPFITTWFISCFKHKQLFFEMYPWTHFPKLLNCPSLSSCLCAALLRKLTHVHQRSGTFAFQAYFSSDLFFLLKGEALWCPSNLITSGPQQRRRLTSSGSAVAWRKWGRQKPCGVKSKWIWSVTRETLWNAQQRACHSIVEVLAVIRKTPSVARECRRYNQ